MKYSTFEELPVWNAALNFAVAVFEFTEKADFKGLGDTKTSLNARPCRSRITSLKDLNEAPLLSSSIFCTFLGARLENLGQCFAFASGSRDFQISDLKFQI
jgi:hypothetical protein